MPVTPLQMEVLEALTSCVIRQPSTAAIHIYMKDYSPSPLPQLCALVKKDLIKCYEENWVRGAQYYWELNDKGHEALS